MTRLLYNVINGRSAATPEVALRFEKAFGGGTDVRLRMQAAHDHAKVRPSQEKITVRRLAPACLMWGHFWPAVVDGIVDRTTMETSRKLLAALTK